jgi:hypothetical protein
MSLAGSTPNMYDLTFLALEIGIYFFKQPKAFELPVSQIWAAGRKIFTRAIDLFDVPRA